MPLFTRALCAALLTLLVASGCDTGDPTADQPLPDRYVLPDGATFPEGIALDEDAGTFYVGSVADGALYRTSLDDETLEPFLDADALPAAVGLALDDDRLWVSGGPSGQAFAVTLGGMLQTTFSSPDPDDDEGTFINDVAVVRDTAYFTDSSRPILFRAAPSDDSDADLEPWLDLDGTAIEYQDGFNLNGIAATPDGQYLIVVQSNTGQLFRVEIATQNVQALDLGGANVTNGDGILLPEDGTLYVVQNANGFITPVELGDDYLSGTVGTSFGGDASLLFPTTIAESDGSLFVVNGQLDEQGPDGDPTLPFTVSRISIP